MHTSCFNAAINNKIVLKNKNLQQMQNKTGYHEYSYKPYLLGQDMRYIHSNYMWYTFLTVTKTISQLIKEARKMFFFCLRI